MIVTSRVTHAAVVTHQPSGSRVTND